MNSMGSLDLVRLFGIVNGSVYPGKDYPRHVYPRLMFLCQQMMNRGTLLLYQKATDAD